jgi:flagellar hook capping protein FlgD
MPISFFRFPIVVLLASAVFTLAQESPVPVASPTPSASPARSVRISFLPPPLEGTISLGIYDANGQLVRVLHQEAGLNEFTVGADALVTKWDGKNNDGEDLPAGKYNARGYLVGHPKVEDLGKAASPPPDPGAAATVQVKLMANPLAKDAKAIVDLAVGFDDENTFLKTTDGMPLLTISTATNVMRASITKSGEKSVDVFQDDGGAVEQFRVSNIDRMMAFDCGDFELK